MFKAAPDCLGQLFYVRFFHKALLSLTVDLSWKNYSLYNYKTF